MYHKRFFLFFIMITCTAALLCGCGSIKEPDDPPVQEKTDLSQENETGGGNRDSTPVVLVPEPSGEVTYGNELVSMDASHLEDGYVMVRYTGDVEKVKLQLLTPSGTLYTYTMQDGYETFPLTDGDGTYKVSVFERQAGTESSYISAFSQTVEAIITNEFSPYLYPNQYVNFTPDSKTVAKGAELADGASDDLEVIARVYDYIIQNVSYDKDKAGSVQSGYVPEVDEILDSGTGICFDYAALMAAMLRTQRIPTRLEIGYAGTVYHAWISTHIDELGWVNGIIEFDGSEWKLMDPTFAANSSSKDLKDFIGKGDNYQTKFIY
ncbi:transglutaminase-like domain-containing protein [Lacrimispora sp. NSJ-141]|uniref:Transglutaminase-like domain-containing protein n=1 Tax=Lientehia hominis TaxID=2897778 RepID=A0AAP2RGE2_9FIRM|nr:transglutaminase-like domain-containing protein [Lientehia hominis]MCD2491436.1 transglutaminase-like domain-containing protein [Lientehia hominis]